MGSVESTAPFGRGSVWRIGSINRQIGSIERTAPFGRGSVWRDDPESRQITGGKTAGATGAFMKSRGPAAHPNRRQKAIVCSTS
ncbi:MAG: hypothetical protein ABSE35_02645, partial [Bryobacteraceae bacterium]